MQNSKSASAIRSVRAVTKVDLPLSGGPAIRVLPLYGRRKTSAPALQPTRNHDAAIVESVLTLARSLGLEVIEGIETGAQEAFLASHGCHEGQGYRYGKPMDAETFLTAAFASRQIEISPTQSHLRIVQSSGTTGGS
ncbi:EAL domain-containing protein [Methylobacterium sp. UNC378MF]|nr:EAL domain-containing protein [Methylobacterium sp. UNC378MF]